MEEREKIPSQPGLPAVIQSQRDPPGVEALPPTDPVKTSRLAIASLVCGVLGFLCLPALVGLILGSRALTQIKKSQGQLRGRGLAITGLSLSGFMLLVACPALTLSVMAIGQAKVEQINCLHQIRSIGLAMRLYSNDNNDVLPLDFLSLSNELSVPKILICPSDTQHTKATNWADFDPRRNVSYEFLHPGIAESNLLTAPQMILLRCPIHDNVCLGDGSWQMGAKPPGGGRPDKPR